MHIALIEPNYYTQYPPLGLLKLSSYHKQLGDTTELVRKRKQGFVTKKPDLIYVTSLFTWAWKPVWRTIHNYKVWFPDVEIWLGGLYASILPEHAKRSRADHIYTGLFKEAEGLMPDYSLVPDWDGSIIFATRGCPNKCPFCIVPKLEGDMNSVKESIKPFVYPGHTRIVLFDNNILASPNWETIFNELIELKFEVDFNQGLDASFLTEKIVKKLLDMKIKLIRFGYDQLGDKECVKQAIELLSREGFRRRNILIYSLYNFTETPKDFFERVKDVLSWGATIYPMRYQPCNTLVKDSFVSDKWTEGELRLVANARRVLGYGGALPPYKGLVRKFMEAENFIEAFSLRSINRAVK